VKVIVEFYDNPSRKGDGASRTFGLGLSVDEPPVGFHKCLDHQLCLSGGQRADDEARRVLETH